MPRKSPEPLPGGQRPIDRLLELKERFSLAFCAQQLGIKEHEAVALLRAHSAAIEKERTHSEWVDKAKKEQAK
jgi:hypothetical protein